MKVLEEEKVVVRPGQTLRGHARVARSVAVTQPIALPSVERRTRTAVRPSLRKSRALAVWSNRAVAFAAITGLVYVGSTLGGYVMLERARQASRHGADRAAFARGEAKAARASIEALSNPATLASWGTAHGFVATASAPQEVEDVAKD